MYDCGAILLGSEVWYVGGGDSGVRAAGDGFLNVLSAVPLHSAERRCLTSLQEGDGWPILRVSVPVFVRDSLA